MRPHRITFMTPYITAQVFQYHVQLSLYDTDVISKLQQILVSK